MSSPFETTNDEWAIVLTGHTAEQERSMMMMNAHMETAEDWRASGEGVDLLMYSRGSLHQQSWPIGF